MGVARGVRRDILDDTLCVHTRRNARPRELRSHEDYWRRYDEEDPVRDMICQLFGGGRRNMRRSKEKKSYGALSS